MYLLSRIFPCSCLDSLLIWYLKLSVGDYCRLGQAGIEAVGIEQNDARSIEKEKVSNYVMDWNDILESNDRYRCPDEMKN